MKDLNYRQGDETSNSELKRMMIRIINEMKEDIHKHLSEIKENINR
jgi:hypothetical protein